MWGIIKLVDVPLKSLCNTINLFVIEFLPLPQAQSQRLARKAKDAPMLAVGVVGFLAACGIGAYKYNRRGTMSTSVFLMQLRVAAQGTVVGALTLGLAYKMFNDYVLPQMGSNTTPKPEEHKH